MNDPSKPSFPFLPRQNDSERNAGTPSVPPGRRFTLVSARAGVGPAHGSPEETGLRRASIGRRRFVPAIVPARSQFGRAAIRSQEEDAIPLGKLRTYRGGVRVNRGPEAKLREMFLGEVGL